MKRLFFILALVPFFIRADDEEGKIESLEGACRMQLKVKYILNMRKKEKPGSYGYVRLTQALDDLRPEGEGWLESYESFHGKQFNPKVCHPAKGK